MVGTTRSRVSFFMNRFRRLGFIHYAGGLEGGLQVRRSHQSHDHASNEYQGRVSSQQFSLKFFLFDIAKFARIVCEEVRCCYGHICVLGDNRIRWGRGVGPEE